MALSYDLLNKWLSAESLPSAVNQQALSGGCICQSYRVSLSDGSNVFIKTLSEPHESLFQCEATGLRTLAETQTVKTPKVLGVDDDYLILEYLGDAAESADYWPALGRSVALLHSNYGPCFGFSGNNYCGASVQPNPQLESGHDFFAEHRLIYQAKIARNNDLITPSELTLIETLCSHLDNLIPVQPPSIIHGDLWGGNIARDDKGEPVLIDPATHWGWAEADIAMTKLFGGFDKDFYDAYQESAKLEPGWQKRLNLYNLYHLLNHLNIFGPSYHAQVISVLRHYS